VTAAAPTITQVNTVADGGGNAVTASSLGGTLVTIEGANYSKKTLVSIDGVPATKTTVLATGTTSKVTAVLPAHASSATTYALKVSSEYGSVLSTSPVTYQGVVAVSPAVGKASTITSIQLTGIGFNAYNSVGFTDSATANKYLVVFAPGGTTLAAAGAHGGIICTKVLVESDTTLSCKTPVNLSGAYSVQIVVADGTDTTKIAASGVKTVVARNATFTAANV
jgi:hypothetical protein